MNEIPLDAETKALEAPGDHKSDIRLWLRLLTCSTLIEGEIRRRLREQFDVTLPRFDLMAQLDKMPEGMTLGEVSKRMMVSNGNVTHVVEKLVASGHIDRRPAPRDRRVQIISLTPAGQTEFRAMAKVHEDWIADMFAGLGDTDEAALMELLGKTKTSVKRALDGGLDAKEDRS
jgi:DNA-binding MarR family transcriptional regulator